MTPDQKDHLTALLPAMRRNACRMPTHNQYASAWLQSNALEAFLKGQESEHTAARWVAIAEAAA